MRGMVALAVLLSALVGTTARAEEQKEEPKKANTLTVGPLALLLGGEVLLKYEHAVSAYGALQLIGSVYLPSLSPISGVTGGIGYSLYPFGKSPGGLYLTPSVALGVGKFSGLSVVVFEIAGDFGYKWVFDGGFVLGAGVGMGRLAATASNGLRSASDVDVRPRLAIDLGGSW